LKSPYVSKAAVEASSAARDTVISVQRTPELVSHKDQIYRSFLQGMVELFVLQQAEKGPVYGVSLNKALHDLGYDISPGSLYPLLHSLEKKRLLHCHIHEVGGRIRKYYELTKEGRSCLAAVRQDLAGLVEELIFDGKPGPTHR
jgi:DNA-binding PadR family transcriptional regulator